MRKATVSLTCDLCGKKATADSFADSRWMELTYENLQEDRSWHEKHLCVACVNHIAMKLKTETEKVVTK